MKTRWHPFLYLECHRISTTRIISLLKSGMVTGGEDRSVTGIKGRKHSETTVIPLILSPLCRYQCMTNVKIKGSCVKKFMFLILYKRWTLPVNFEWHEKGMWFSIFKLGWCSCVERRFYLNDSGLSGHFLRRWILSFLLAVSLCVSSWKLVP